jgi:hypothetical protein
MNIKIYLKNIIIILLLIGAIDIVYYKYVHITHMPVHIIVN